MTRLVAVVDDDPRIREPLAAELEGLGAELYRRCTENLRLEAQTKFRKSAHQMGQRVYCAEERALLARDKVHRRAEPLVMPGS
ncbi:hypothetical protein [Synechococcus sp. LTW-R]|uniref:hypothetical protein n=1 Tax=Synechococcus sp. LTW-R TaxID=2751170 RepID=UPI0016276D07|nr:hypothetical protein [Synechococcus sp. LTW-R]QNG28537.1 hypothetical protein H0O22_06975 [Synechococcus sp. LTW-R]